jgi:hypothetical protein
VYSVIQIVFFPEIIMRLPEKPMRSEKLAPYAAVLGFYSTRRLVGI